MKWIELTPRTNHLVAALKSESPGRMCAKLMAAGFVDSMDSVFPLPSLLENEMTAGYRLMLGLRLGGRGKTGGFWPRVPFLMGGLLVSSVFGGVKMLGKIFGTKKKEEPTTPVCVPLCPYCSEPLNQVLQIRYISDPKSAGTLVATGAVASPQREDGTNSEFSLHLCAQCKKPLNSVSITNIQNIGSIGIPS